MLYVPPATAPSSTGLWSTDPSPASGPLDECGANDGACDMQLEGKYSDKSLGKPTSTSSLTSRELRKVSKQPPTSAFASLGPVAIFPRNGRHRSHGLDLFISFDKQIRLLFRLLMVYRGAGLTLTQTWNTANALDTKIELADSLAKGLKAETIFQFLPASNNTGAKLNLTFKQSAFHGRAFFDLLKGPTANVDAVIGHEGFLAGASAGYDVQKAAVTGYSAAVGYVAPQYSAAVTATDNLSVFAASYYHKVNKQVEASAKAVWNSKSGNAVGLEVATKYRLDPVSFAKVCCFSDTGITAS